MHALEHGILLLRPSRQHLELSEGGLLLLTEQLLLSCKSINLRLLLSQLLLPRRQFGPDFLHDQKHGMLMMRRCHSRFVVPEGLNQ